MKNYIISIDQSTSATKAILFDSECKVVSKCDVPHKQYYPENGWVEHDPVEIYNNTLKVIRSVVEKAGINNCEYSLAITNQRETVVVWNKNTGNPVYNAVVWQCKRGGDICRKLIDEGYTDLIREKTGLIINPYFSASGVSWILQNVEGAGQSAAEGDLLLGTVDTWLLWKLTGGKIHATDYTNACRTLLFNINTLEWDKDILKIFGIPETMMPAIYPCDSIFGETTAEGFFEKPVKIAGILGDSHGALVGQMCFEAGYGKATYGTGSSVMFNIGEKPKIVNNGLVTSIGFAALGKVFYAFEGNIHCTGAAINWLRDQAELISGPEETEGLAKSVKDNDGVYFVPAFAGLGAPWWKDKAKAAISGMTLGTTKAHIVRSALESISYQVKDLVDLMSESAGINIKELRVDGGATNNKFLMQFQSDMINSTINISDVSDASALGAMIVNGFALRRWTDFGSVEKLHGKEHKMYPEMPEKERIKNYSGWIEAVKAISY